MSEARFTEYKHKITQKYSSKHQAVDIGSNKDEKKNNITAHSNGVVKKVYNGCNKTYKTGNSYGNYIEIDLGGGYSQFQAHIKKDSFKVKKGDIVKQGQVVAVIGNTGHSTGPHCHTELRLNGKKIDPTPYLYADLPKANVQYKLLYAKWLRKTPKVAANKIKKYAKGTKFYTDNIISLDTKGNKWVKTTLNGKTGYICIYDSTGEQAKVIS